MTDNNNEAEFENEIPPRAVSVIPSDGGMDEFPVLKAFQQYIDNEQSKARKRLFMICTAFVIFLLIVVSVFSMMLINVTQRNQQLNDRLVDYAMKERERPQGSAVVVQPAQDNSALLALTAKLEEMRKQFETEKQERAQADAKRAEEAKRPSPQELEVQRLMEQLKAEKAQLNAEREKVAAEKEKVAAEKAKQRESELESYRRKHYPELYEPKTSAVPAKTVQAAAKPATADKKPEVRKTTKPRQLKSEDVDAILDELDDEEPLNYFDEDDEDEEIKPVKKPVKSPARRNASTKEDSYKIPVETIEPQPESRWRIPNI